MSKILTTLRDPWVRVEDKREALGQTFTNDAFKGVFGAVSKVFFILRRQRMLGRETHNCSYFMIDWL